MILLVSINNFKPNYVQKRSIRLISIKSITYKLNINIKIIVLSELVRFKYEIY